MVIPFDNELPSGQGQVYSMAGLEDGRKELKERYSAEEWWEGYGRAKYTSPLRLSIPLPSRKRLAGD
jgi:hypothetical protein